MSEWKAWCVSITAPCTMLFMHVRMEVWCVPVVAPIGAPTTRNRENKGSTRWHHIVPANSKWAYVGPSGFSLLCYFLLRTTKNHCQRQVDKDYHHHRAKELDSGFGGDSSGSFEAKLGPYGKRGRVLGPVVGAYGEMSDNVYANAEAVEEELATEHCGFYSDKKQGAVAAFFLSQTHRSWRLVAHRG